MADRKTRRDRELVATHKEEMENSQLGGRWWKKKLCFPMMYVAFLYDFPASSSLSSFPILILFFNIFLILCLPANVRLRQVPRNLSVVNAQTLSTVGFLSGTSKNRRAYEHTWKTFVVRVFLQAILSMGWTLTGTWVFPRLIPFSILRISSAFFHVCFHFNCPVDSLCSGVSGVPVIIFEFEKTKVHFSPFFQIETLLPLCQPAVAFSSTYYTWLV